MFICKWLLLVILVALHLFSCDGAGAYKVGDKVEILVNTVGPYFNPHETYPYYSLPVCKPKEIEYKSMSLGEVLDGDRIANSGYQIEFGIDKANSELCTVEVDEKGLNELKKAVEELYYFEMFADGFAMRNFLGRVEVSDFFYERTVTDHKLWLYDHIAFHFTYNEDKIVSANVTTKDSPSLSLDQAAPINITYRYSVTWENTTLNRKNRENFSFFPKTLEIHWMALINSLIIVLLVIGSIVVALTRGLRKEIPKSNKSDSQGLEKHSDDDFGWKVIHTDVFRFPPYKSLFCSILGVGCQLLFVTIGLIIIKSTGLYGSQSHGSFNTTCVLLYALTSCIAGFVSSSYYRKFDGKNWARNILLTSVLFTGPFIIVWAVINIVHWTHGSTQALPPYAMLWVGLIWLGVAFPLTVLGGIMGKNLSCDFYAPCPTENLCREVPRQRWYCSSVAHTVLGGVMTFGVISVELFFVFKTIWSRQIYGFYGMLLLVLAMLLIASSCISVALSYYQLRSEDYRWWWRSVLNAGSAGFYVFIYAIFFYFKRSEMFGAVQSVEYFGYAVVLSFAFFLILGAVSFFASLKFVRFIYKKLEISTQEDGLEAACEHDVPNSCKT